MIARIEINETTYKVDFSKPLDISIPLRAGIPNVNAWYVDPVEIEPVKTDQFVGSVKLGGSVNFRNIRFNPHGNGTHTECVGHISVEDISINKCLKHFMFLSQLISITPKKMDKGDLVITYDQLKSIPLAENCEGIILRTLPNPLSKKDFQYSDTNPPYIEKEAMQYLIDHGFNHFLIDLPSVDRELDEGVLAAHHVFWNYPDKPVLERTITELIYVEDAIKDGVYLLNLQIASFENDASPSKPVLYALKD